MSDEEYIPDEKPNAASNNEPYDSQDEEPHGIPEKEPQNIFDNEPGSTTDDEAEDIPEDCIECGRPITIATVTFQDKPYHPECFVCAQCLESLCGKLIYKVDGKRVDKDCYCKFYARKCAICEEPLLDPKVRYLSFGGLTYHGECFCCIKCGETLAGRKFYALDQGNTCEKCYDTEHDRQVVIEDL